MCYHIFHCNIQGCAFNQTTCYVCLTRSSTETMDFFLVMYSRLLLSFSQFKLCTFLTSGYKIAFKSAVSNQKPVDKTKSPSYKFFFLDNVFHLDVCHIMEENIYRYNCYILTLLGAESADPLKLRHLECEVLL